VKAFGRLMLVLGATAWLGGYAGAQPPRFSFTDGKPGWMDVEMLLQNASVARELSLNGQQELRARQALFAALPWYSQEVQKVFKLPREQQQARQLELLDRYQQEQYKILGRVLAPSQLRRLKQIQVRVAGIDAFAQPWVQKDLRLTLEQKQKIEAVAREFAATKKKDEAAVEEPLKKVLQPEQQRGLKLIQDTGVGIDAITQPWVQKQLRLTRPQQEQVKSLTKEIAEARKKEETLQPDTLKNATDLLTSDQRKKWDELAGKPFKLQVRFGKGGPP
jgi:hypothetical protein